MSHEIAMLPGVTFDASGEPAKMRKLLHDELIRMTGSSRRSGVRWRQWNGHETAETVLRDLYADDPDRWALIEQHYLPTLAQLGGRAVLVIAECDADPAWDGDRS